MTQQANITYGSNNPAAPSISSVEYIGPDTIAIHGSHFGGPPLDGTAVFISFKGQIETTQIFPGFVDIVNDSRIDVIRFRFKEPGIIRIYVRASSIMSVPYEFRVI